MALSDTTVRLLVPLVPTTHRRRDGWRLFVTAKAQELAFRFCWGGKATRISLGIYREISLRDTRTRGMKPAFWSQRYRSARSSSARTHSGRRCGREHI